MPENRIAGKTNGAQPPSDQPVSILSPPGLVSILIPCCGMLEYTKLCVPSLLRHSRPPFELIFIDIGSLDGTVEYLAGVKTATNLRVEVVRTPTDLGIQEACKEALAQARGEYIVLLNNDTIVTHAWLNQLIALSGSSPVIGLVGPMSNYAAPPQLIEEPLPYRVGAGAFGGVERVAQSAERSALRAPRPPSYLRQELFVDVSAVDRFADDFRTRHLGNWLETDRLGGFCLLLKRAVLKKIEAQESLDKISDLGLFDTDILSAKARKYGFTLGVCRDLFIHHFGTRTFAHGAPAPAREDQPVLVSGGAS